MFIIQALLAGVILCVPGNITAIILLATPNTKVPEDIDRGANLTTLNTSRLYQN